DSMGRGDDGNRNRLHLGHELVAEREQLTLLVERLIEHLLQVVARRKRAAGAFDDDGADFGPGCLAFELGCELFHQSGGQHVELKETQAAWHKLLRLSLVSREEVPGGLRLIVHPGSADALRRLIDVERECCRWITFELDGPMVKMTASDGGEAAIREMWSPP